MKYVRLRAVIFRYPFCQYGYGVSRPLKDTPNLVIWILFIFSQTATYIFCLHPKSHLITNIINNQNYCLIITKIISQVWMFQRFTVVMEYQQKPVLPPPLIAFSHFYSLLKYCLRKAKGTECW